MSIPKLVFVSCLLACAAAPAAAQTPGRNATVYYHWVTSEQVILWNSLKDDRPVIATYNSNSKEWGLAPVKAEQAHDVWRQLLRDIVLRSEPQADLEKVDDGLMWKYVLSRLRNDHGTAQSGWAQPNLPSMEIYLRPEKNVKGEWLAADLVVIKNAAGQSVRGIVPFTFQPDPKGGQWVKGQKVDETQLFGRPPTVELFRAIFGFGADDAPPVLQASSLPAPNAPAEWKSLYDESLKRFLANGHAVRHVMYQGAGDGKPLHWFWCEVLPPGAELPVVGRRPSDTPRDTSVPELPLREASLTGSALSLWQQVAIGAGGGLLLAIGLFWIIFARGNLAQRYRRWLTWRRNRAADDGAAQPPRAPALTADTLWKLHKLALERCKKEFEGHPPVSAEVLLAGLDYAHDLYKEVAASQHLLAQEDERNEAAVAEYRRQSLKVEDSDAAKVPRWVEIGRAAEAAASRVNGLHIPPKVAARVNGDSAPGKSGQAPMPEYLLAHWAELLLAFGNQLSEEVAANNTLDENYKALEALLEEQNNNREQIIEEKKEEIEAKWKGDYEGAVRMYEELNTTYALTSDELRTAKDKIEELTQEVARLEADLTADREATSSARNELEGLRRRTEAIGQVRKLSSDLRQWMEGYFQERMDKDGEVRPVALVSALINFTLCQMCLSIADDQEPLSRALAFNIVQFTQKFDRKPGKQSEFPRVPGYLKSIVGGEGEPHRKPEESETSKDAIDEYLFRGFLLALRSDTEKDWSPFYIDYDRDNKIAQVQG